MLRRCVVLLASAILCGQIAAAPQAGRLDPTPLLAETLGLRMQVPRGATVTTQIAEDRVIYNVVGDDGGWSMRLEAMRSADPGATAESLARQQLSAIEGTGRIFRVLRDTPGTFGGVEGHLLFVQQSLGEGNSIVNGWVILPRGRQTFLFLSAAASPDEFRQLEPALDESFSTIVLLSEAEIIQVRDARLKRGREMTDRMTEDRLRSAISDRRWFRI